jgi:hypothetical protein
MPFGLHRYLPQQVTYITVLRDPIDRTISDYYFAATGAFHPDHRAVKKLTLKQFVCSTPNNNVQTKLLAGLAPGYDFLAGDCSTEMLAVAIANLRHFSLIALTERFDESLALAKRLFGWKIRRYVSFRVTPGRHPKDSIPPTTRDLIADLNAFDVALYRHATLLFEDMVAQHSQYLFREMQAVRRAKDISPTEAFFYRASSTALKTFTNLNSAMWMR